MPDVTTALPGHCGPAVGTFGPAPDRRCEVPRSGVRGRALARNEPSEAGVDRAYERFLSAGASVVKRPAETDWGGYSGCVADLDWTDTSG
jgi:uncharacterized glyoxalase superfamily protein PhnB